MGTLGYPARNGALTTDTKGDSSAKVRHCPRCGVVSDRGRTCWRCCRDLDIISSAMRARRPS